MSRYKTIEITREGPVARVWLDRPEVKNAFNENVIAELTDACRALAGDEVARVVTLSGRGEVFSAGADLNWMQKVGAYTCEENLDDARRFAAMIEGLYRLPQATVAAVNGPCIGGGVGLLSACDVAVGSDRTFFSLAEIRLGIAPAVISPYVIRKIGERGAREFFLTGKRFDAAKACEIGLLNSVVAHDDFAAAVARWEKSFLRSAPGAVKACKELIARVSRAPIGEVQEYTAEVISKLRMAPEGREGFAAFFDRRRPAWDPDAE
ncbi:MAG: enoyl-CoA hydratase-related protein [Candidatus Krumholzibacteriia bacterium]